MQRFINALNSIHPSVYGFVLIMTGAALTMYSPDTGKELIVGGFALVTGAKMQEASQGGEPK